MKMREFKILFLVLLFGSGLYLTSCQSDDIVPKELESGRSYYPISVGRFWIYKVDSTNYAFNGEVSKGTFYLKEKISDSLYRQEGSMVYRIEISKGLTETGPWLLDSIWTIRKDIDKIIKTENNRPIVKLRFPLKDGNAWDGNAFNPLQDSNTVFLYTIKDLGKSVDYKGETIPSLEVVQKIDSNCINKSAFLEIYYENIGLGYKRASFIQYSQSGTDPCSRPIPLIEIGYDKIFTLVNNGLE